MTEKKPIHDPDEDNHPLAGCVLHEAIKRGEYPKHSYPQNGLPEVTVESAPAKSLFVALWKAGVDDER